MEQSQSPPSSWSPFLIQGLVPRPPLGKSSSEFRGPALAGCETSNREFGTAFSEKPGVSYPETKGPRAAAAKRTLQEPRAALCSLWAAEQAGWGHLPGSEGGDSESKAVAPAGLECSQTWALKHWDPECSRAPGQAEGLANVEIAGSWGFRGLTWLSGQLLERELAPVASRQIFLLRQWVQGGTRMPE